ncbi:PREDICTED: BPI fold-containing family A member 2 [Chrysochloris asiatica]|uniref:BPI fold-containing family A member 2 n=1 Tax=Chrysochloris asiatica TaxID=185453 RepID=A0A9B0TB65_CHRAS|nr:PREDICTED: BPI fold-containing family A member 2 [Chrysochloris asiatica]
MVPLWKLVLLCGILTGTSASLLGNIGSELNVLDNLKPIVDDGRKLVDNTLDILDNKISDILPDLKEKLPTLQEPSFLKQAYEKLQKSKAVLSNVFSRLIPRIITFLKLKLSKYNIIDIKAELTPDGQGLKMKIPVTTTAVDK